MVKARQPKPQPPPVIYARYFPKDDRWFCWHAGEFREAQHRDSDTRYVPVATLEDLIAAAEFTRDYLYNCDDDSRQHGDALELIETALMKLKGESDD